MTSGSALNMAPGVELSDAPTGSSKRREPRIKASWSGLIRLPDGRELPCLVKDVSKSGAKLSVPPVFPLAKSFLVKVEERGFAFAVSLMWRQAGYAGVRIDKIVKLAGGAIQVE